MNAVLMVGGSIAAATAAGSVIGCLLENLRRSTYGAITGAAAGVMLCAAVHGLLLSAMDSGGAATACGGVMIGAMLLHWMNAAVSKLMRTDLQEDAQRLNGLMFVFAIAIHHFPEGLAAGVSFGTGEAAETAAVCTAIALQNIPEAMMIMPAMAAYGRGKAVLAAVVSGMVELSGLLVGYMAVQLTVLLLPVLLALAAGAMLYVILENMLPDAYHAAPQKTSAAVLAGYCGMLMMSALVDTFLS